MRNTKNSEVLHSFIEGMKTDFHNNAESNKSFEKGQNGRLYSENGMISYSCLKGTKEVFSNPSIVKYLGYYAFEDELILFMKALPEYNSSEGTVSYTEIKKIIAKTINTQNDIPYNNCVVFFDGAISEVIQQVPIYTADEDPLNFKTPLSCVTGLDGEFNSSEYYASNFDFANFENCGIGANQQNYDNNVDFIDVIVSLKKDSSNNIYENIVWTGFQNWPIDGKIVTYGIYENNFYKRIYYTDYVNTFRSLNLKDPNISTRNAVEFNNFQGTSLLQPKIIGVNNLGQIKAGTTFYTYRLLTANGQVTEFSPFSFPQKILFDDTGIDYAGGDISKITTKSVTIKCNLINYQNFNEIEAVAIEYEAEGSPTAIRSLGIKSVANSVDFTHYGNEAEFSSVISISDLTERKNSFKYCSSIESVNNRMYVSGLRNDPLPTGLAQMTQDFSLHGWDAFGETHLCLLNPEPWKYRYIDPTNNSKLYYVKQKLYNSILIFSGCNIKLVNSITDEFIETTIINENDEYLNQNNSIWNWINSIQSTPDFITKFPNLKIEYTQQKIVFLPINTAIQTDMEKYVFEFSTSQVIEDVEKDIQFINLAVNTSALIYGAISLGFSQGNGIRITFQTELEEILTKSTRVFQANDVLMDIKEPNLKKSFFKNEIYRLAIQLFGEQGEQLFAIPIGDLHIPQHGEIKKGFDDSGTPFYSVEYYQNSRKIGDKLYAEKIKLRVEVRLSCEVQKIVSMYQLAYVERDQDNRTILAQGISAPMERTQTFFHLLDNPLPEPVNQKWNLPYFGGPTYDGFGLRTQDIDPENEDLGYENGSKRIVTHRSMFYFDSPEFIYSRLSVDLIRNGSVKRIARVNTDHNAAEIRNSSGEVYPKFSRKIKADVIDFTENYEPEWMNVSVFANEKLGLYNLIPISKAEELLEGEQMSGYKMDTKFDVSNNALTLGVPSWFYSGYARKSEICPNFIDKSRSELFGTSNYSIGRKTIVIKTEEPVFTNAFIAQNPFYPDGEVRLSGGIPTYDTHAIINIELNNRANVYGGRSELAYSKNIYVPLSETIPVVKNSNGTQVFKVYGDTYVSLQIRNKNYFSLEEPGAKTSNNSGNCSHKHRDTRYCRTGAWAYACVLETAIEPKFNYKDTFWRQNNNFNFEPLSEAINEAYFQEKGMKTYIAKPFKFKDDPNMGNIIAASDVKTSGSNIDQWTVFKINNFYELEKNKGVAHNLAKDLDILYCIQENQTSKLEIDPRTMIPSEGGEISIKQGVGIPILNHTVISDYGTAIRRSVVNILFSTDKIKGFSFFDEKRIEFVRVGIPLLLEKQLHLGMYKEFLYDPIVDSEGYYDDENKESNIRLRTKSGKYYTLSFNEVFQVFNGNFEYNADIFMVWNKSILAPITTIIPFGLKTRPESIYLHELNKGEYLKFFGDYKTFKIGVICNPDANKISIFKHWAANINVDFPITKIKILTSSGQNRIIMGSHHRYDIREGVHSVPLKNRNDWDDLRGHWMYLEVEINSLYNKKIDILSLINFVRNSNI